MYEIVASYPELKKYYGLLSGAAFTLAHSVASLFSGQFADKYNRKVMLGICCVIWSASTMTSGLVNSFAVLFVMRFILGAFQSA